MTEKKQEDKLDRILEKLDNLPCIDHAERISTMEGGSGAIKWVVGLVVVAACAVVAGAMT